MRLRRSLIAVAAAGALVVLAGCTDSPAPPTSSTSSATSPSPSTSASPSTSPNATATTGIEGINIPADALKHTYAGAQAMAKFFVEESDKAYVTNDSTKIQAMSASSCIGCQNAVLSIAASKKKGEHQLTASVHVDGFSPQAVRPLNEVQTVDVLVTISAVDVVDQTGQKVSQNPAAKTVFRVRPIWAGSFWRIQAIGTAKL